MRLLRQASQATLFGPRPEALVVLRAFFASSLSYPADDPLRLMATVFASWLARALSICDATLDETRSGGVLNTSNLPGPPDGKQLASVEWLFHPFGDRSLYAPGRAFGYTRNVDSTSYLR